MSFEPMTCPFCGEADFDRIGLRQHLKRGWCEVFEEDEADPPLELPPAVALPLSNHGDHREG